MYIYSTATACKSDILFTARGCKLGLPLEAVLSMSSFCLERLLRQKIDMADAHCMIDLEALRFRIWSVLPIMTARTIARCTCKCWKKSDWCVKIHLMCHTDERAHASERQPRSLHMHERQSWQQLQQQSHIMVKPPMKARRHQPWNWNLTVSAHLWRLARCHWVCRDMVL